MTYETPTVEAVVTAPARPAAERAYSDKLRTVLYAKHLAYASIVQAAAEPAGDGRRMVYKPSPYAQMSLDKFCGLYDGAVAGGALSWMGARLQAAANAAQKPTERKTAEELAAALPGYIAMHEADIAAALPRSVFDLMRERAAQRPTAGTPPAASLPESFAPPAEAPMPSHLAAPTRAAQPVDAGAGLPVLVGA